MIDRLLVDTNVLVYPYDHEHPAKRLRALEVLERVAPSGQGVLTTQVVGEFFRVVTTRLRHPLPLEEAERQIRAYLRAWAVMDVTSLVVLEAVRGAREHHLQYWDAQLWATALLNQIPVILTEDFSDGQVIEGIRCLNPFSLHFQMARLDE